MSRLNELYRAALVCVIHWLAVGVSVLLTFFSFHYISDGHTKTKHSEMLLFCQKESLLLRNRLRDLWSRRLNWTFYLIWPLTCELLVFRCIWRGDSFEFLRLYLISIAFLWFRSISTWFRSIFTWFLFSPFLCIFSFLPVCMLSRFLFSLFNLIATD